MARTECPIWRNFPLILVDSSSVSFVEFSFIFALREPPESPSWPSSVRDRIRGLPGRQLAGWPGQCVSSTVCDRLRGPARKFLEYLELLASSDLDLRRVTSENDVSLLEEISGNDVDFTSLLRLESKTLATFIARALSLFFVLTSDPSLISNKKYIRWWVY